MQRRERAEEQQSEETKSNFSMNTLHQVRAMKFFLHIELSTCYIFYFTSFPLKVMGKDLSMK
jgi:hypothetical protein